MKFKTDLYMILEANDATDARQMVKSLVMDLNELMGHYMGVEALVTWPEHFQGVAETVPEACEGLEDLDMTDEDDECGQEALTKEELKEILRAEGLEVFDWAEHVSTTKH